VVSLQQAPKISSDRHQRSGASAMKEVCHRMSGPESPQAVAPALDQRLVDALGLPGGLISTRRMSRAWSNHLHHVRTTAGEFAVKHLLNPWDDPHWRGWLDEAIVLEQAAIDAGVRAPLIVPNRAGEVLTDVQGATYRVHRWIDGAHPCPEAPVTADVADAVGADLARVHATAITPSRTEVFPRVDAATARRWHELVDELRSAPNPGAGPVTWAERAAAVSDEVEQVVEWFDEWRRHPAPTVMSHGDVDPKNLVLDGDGRTWWVDWDVAAPWRPADELARTALSLSGLDRPDLARRVVEAYRRVAPATDTEMTHQNLALDLVVGLDWTTRCLRRASGLDVCDPQRRDEAVAMAVDELDGLPRRMAVARDLPRWLAT